MITGSPPLKVLDISWNNIGDNGIFLCLQYISTLIELNVTGCELSIEGTTAIRQYFDAKLAIIAMHVR